MDYNEFVEKTKQITTENHILIKDIYRRIEMIEKVLGVDFEDDDNEDIEFEND